MVAFSMNQRIFRSLRPSDYVVARFGKLQNDLLPALGRNNFSCPVDDLIPSRNERFCGLFTIGEIDTAGHGDVGRFKTTGARA
jgi:hypothetical protein